VTTPQAVLGKFFASWTVLALALALTFPMVITVAYLGDPDNGPIITGYVGALLMAGAYLAIGSFFSAITRNQVIAFILAVVACGAFHYAGDPTAVNFMAGFLPRGLVTLMGAGLEGMEVLSFRYRFESIQRGVLAAGDVLFFVVLGAGWLWANTVVLEERKGA
jgi:ABC-2 type transport system permease protein